MGAEPREPAVSAGGVAIRCGSLSDANGRYILPRELRPYKRGMRMVGRAVTVIASADLVPVLTGLQQCGAGDILVVDAGTTEQAVVGELFATEAVRRGMAGIVVYGLCRDTATLIQPLPIYSLGTIPCAPGQLSFGHRQPIRLGDVDVRPGEILVGDDDGIVVLSDAELHAALEAAETIQRREGVMRSAIQDGTSLFEQLNFSEHVENLGRATERVEVPRGVMAYPGPTGGQPPMGFSRDGAPTWTSAYVPAWHGNSIPPCPAIGRRRSSSFPSWRPSSVWRRCWSRTRWPSRVAGLQDPRCIVGGESRVEPAQRFRHTGDKPDGAAGTCGAGHLGHGYRWEPRLRRSAYGRTAGTRRTHLCSRGNGPGDGGSNQRRRCRGRADRSELRRSGVGHQRARLGHRNDLLIQDTAWKVMSQIPRWIVDGYGTLFDEIDEQIGRRGIHLVAVPTGVRSLVQAALQLPLSGPPAATGGPCGGAGHGRFRHSQSCRGQAGER